MTIAGTYVVSEIMKEAPSAGVLAWAQTLGPEDLTISVVTVEEIDRGLGRLPKGPQRKVLRWGTLLDAFADTIATCDLAAARATARTLVEGMDEGRPMSLANAQITGICITNAATLATRNVKDFAGVGDLIVSNPFEVAFLTRPLGLAIGTQDISTFPAPWTPHMPGPHLAPRTPVTFFLVKSQQGLKSPAGDSRSINSSKLPARSSADASLYWCWVR